MCVGRGRVTHGVVEVGESVKSSCDRNRITRGPQGVINVANQSVGCFKTTWDSVCLTPMRLGSDIISVRDCRLRGQNRLLLYLLPFLVGGPSYFHLLMPRKHRYRFYCRQFWWSFFRCFGWSVYYQLKYLGSWGRLQGFVWEGVIFPGKCRTRL